MYYRWTFDYHKKSIQQMAKATGNLIGNKIVNRVKQSVP